MPRSKLFRGRTLNLARKRALGERYLRLAAVANLDEGAALLQNSAADTHRCCLVALAVGWLGSEEHRDILWRIAPDEHPRLQRVAARASSNYQRRQFAEPRSHAQTKARSFLAQYGLSSTKDVIRILADRSFPLTVRTAAAEALGGLRMDAAIPALLAAFAEGDDTLAWQCSTALHRLYSRKAVRGLCRLARHSPFPRVRLEAVYCLWMLPNDPRAEHTLITVALYDTEEEVRSRAVEALGNTARRRRSQQALAQHLLNPSVDTRYSALCALSLSWIDRYPQFLCDTLQAKLQDPDRLDDDRVVAELAARLLER